MPKFRKKPVVVEATQWHKNGDHPLDGVGMEAPDGLGGVYQRIEGLVVRFFRHPDVAGTTECKLCAKTMHDHGWIETLEGGHIVCPGDWIIKGVKGEFYPCKPDIFAATYDVVGEFEIVRDSDGWGDTALIRQCSADHNHDECDMGPWLKERGFEWSITDMQTDIDDDHPAYISYFEQEGHDVSQWEPSNPCGDGWFLASVHDTEDGPQALWLRKAA